MARRVFLHIGASKTGTTFLQGMCDANRPHLEAGGTLFPAPLVDHFRFMRFVFGTQNGRPPSRVARVGYDRVVSAVRDHDGSVLISNELLAAATPLQIDAVAKALAPAEVHVIYTVRDLARTLPAEWQQAVKGGSSLRLDDFADGVMARFGEPVETVPTIIGESHAVEKFPVLHDVVAVLDRWSATVEPSRIHLVTLPPSGGDPGLLWQRFCSAADLDPAAGVNPPRRRNESLGAAEAETLRRVNEILASDGGYDFARGEWVRSNFVLPLVTARAARTRIAIRDTHHTWAVSQAAEIVAALRAASYDVVGDPDDLMPSDTVADGIHPADLSADELGAVAIGWVASLLARERAAAGRR